MPTSPTRSYRCYYHPRPDEASESGVLPFLQVKASESGVLPFLQIKACDAEQAAQRAWATVGLPISRCERLELAAEVLA